jgi:hypothetical protein
MPPPSSRRRCDAGRAAEGHCGLHYAAANELEEQAAATEKRRQHMTRPVLGVIT